LSRRALSRRALSRDDSVVVEVLCVAEGQTEFKAAPPSSGPFSMLALPFALLDRFNVFLLMFPDSIAVLEIPTTPPAAPGGRSDAQIPTLSRSAETEVKMERCHRTAMRFTAGFTLNSYAPNHFVGQARPQDSARGAPVVSVFLFGHFPFQHDSNCHWVSHSFPPSRILERHLVSPPTTPYEFERWVFHLHKQKKSIGGSSSSTNGRLCPRCTHFLSTPLLFVKGVFNTTLCRKHGES